MYSFHIYTENSHTGDKVLQCILEPNYTEGTKHVYKIARNEARTYVQYEEARLEIYKDDVLIMSEKWWEHTCWTGDTARLHIVHTAPHRQHT